MATGINQLALQSAPVKRTLALWWARNRMFVVEWTIILLAAVLYAAPNLLNLDPTFLQQTGEHNESATLPLLAEIGLLRYGQIPLWNPYMLTGYPHVGDMLMHFWHPVATIPVLIFGGINGMKVSIFLAFLIAGWGQWFFGHQVGLRGLMRLWSALLFMLSGGLAMLWRSGWYELLLGAAWFPWCFGTFWWMIRRKDRASLALAAVCIAMVLTTGGGYYPVYLGVMLIGLGALLVLFAPAAERWTYVRRAVVVSLLAVGLSAVMLLPFVDGFRLTGRDSGMDVNQEGSQPIPYALINYIIGDTEWYDANILGTKGGWNWFFIGWLPVAALALALLALRARRYRVPVIILSLFLLLIFAWVANKYLPVSLIYERIPFLLNFRFPNRLLIIAASPLIVLGGLGLQYVYTIAKARASRVRIFLAGDKGMQSARSITLRPFVIGGFVLFLLFTLQPVYDVNKSWNFSSGRIDPKSFRALEFIKQRDPGLFYTNVGGGFPLFQWMAAAYTLEMPIINFRYNRRLLSMDEQEKPEAPFRAQPRYILSLSTEPRPASARLVRSFGDMELAYVPDALPFAFSASSEKLRSGESITFDDATALDARLDGPNRVIVTGEIPENQQLVVLVSDYPGWRVSVDNVPAAVEAVNGYLGARAQPGQHTFTFEFHPVIYDIGLIISLGSLALVIALVVLDVVRPR